jgi:HSP20 family molecular chaperone IbpA
VSEAKATVGGQHVPVNMWETGGSLVVVAPMPGVMAEDVEVSLEGGTLRLRAGERSQAQKRDYSLHEWGYGPYERTLELPDAYRGSVAATLGNGQLAVRVGKTGTGEDQQSQTVVPSTAGTSDDM